MRRQPWDALTAAPGTGRARRCPRGTRHAARSQAVEHQHQKFADIVDEVSGKLQLDVARAATSDLRGREKALEVLTRLMDHMPEAAKPGLARAIAALSSDGADEVADLSSALAGGTLHPAAQQAVGQALAQALSAIDGAIEHLNGIARRVPEQARPHV